MNQDPEDRQSNNRSTDDQGPRLLVVEDEVVFARAAAKRLGMAGYRTEIANTIAQARHSLDGPAPDLVLLDLRLPDGSGLEFLSDLRERFSEQLPVIVLTAYGGLEDAVAAMKLHASDYLKKPIDLDELLLKVDTIMAGAGVAQRLEYSHKREQHSTEGIDLLGEHPSMVQVREQIRHIGSLCANAAEVPPTVLILGETGTGKDLAARLLHRVSGRRQRPFVHVDCAALPKDLFEAELFGHEKGAFTGAHSARTGLIEAAEDGMVFLDEIGELPMELQAKLLAVLERRSLRRLGSSRERSTNAWFVAATNRDVETMMANKELRADLYFRLNVLSLRMPPLRQRGDDVLLLAGRFLDATVRRYGLGPVTFSRAANTALAKYPWPGNVRELKHLIERAALLARDGPIDAQALMLPSAETPPPESADLDWQHMTLEEAEYMLIDQALQRTGHNVSEAARQLGLSRMTMRYRMQKHGFVRGD